MMEQILADKSFLVLALFDAFVIVCVIYAIVRYIVEAREERWKESYLKLKREHEARKLRLAQLGDAIDPKPKH